VELRTATADQLDAVTLYELLRLRTNVFVVEQRCPYPELDGRDLEPGAHHAWLEDDGRVVACIRLLREPAGAWRLGRVATAPPARGRGLAARLVRHGLALAGRPVVADAQAHLADWYAGFGFVRAGDDFLDDDILHTPMRLE
jgi:ElaA protein